MNRNRHLIMASLVAVYFLAIGSAVAAKQGGKVKIKGFITGHTGNTLVVKTIDDEFTVVLSEDTKIRKPKGFVGTQRPMSAADLVPGLKVTVEGRNDGEYRVIAESITFDASDLQSAKMVQAGVTPTEQKGTVNQQNAAANKQTVDANKQTIEVNKQSIDAAQQEIAANKKSIEENQAAINKGFAGSGEDAVKDQVTVNFAVGSSEISTEAQKQLKQLAHGAVKLKSYMIQVKGFADSSGNASTNQKLSQDRAQAVIAYLLQECDVPMRNISIPAAMGTTNPEASNETADGRAENRKVEVVVRQAAASE